MGCGKRAWCRKQQAPPIALVWCKNPSKECLRPSLSIRPSGLPKHLGMWVKRRRWASGTPKNFLIQEEEWFMPPRQHWKKGEWDDYPLKSVKTVVNELYTQSAVLSFTHKPEACPSTWKQRKTQTRHWNLLVDMGTLSGRVSMLCLKVHMQKIKTTCVHTQLWQKQNSCEQVPSTMSQKQHLQITN